MSSIYIVHPLESITDVVMNATGSLSNWDMILTANNFTDWTPDLQPGQNIIIPDGVFIDNNTLRQLGLYPSSNNWLASQLLKLAAIFETLFDNWILADGTWNDKGVWIDTDFWNDAHP